MDGCSLTKGPLDPERAQNLLVAALLHDSGYIMESGDYPGTGAKYTSCHVQRGVDFVLKNAARFDLGPERALAVGRCISFTDLASPPPFAPVQPYATGSGTATLGAGIDQDGAIGAILGTADILGQMADRSYLEKLLFLYFEFREAGFPGYHTEFDMLRKTVDFYSSARKRLEEALLGFHGLCRDHFSARFGIDRDLYIESIEHQMDYLGAIIKDDSSNFRKKLKRIDLERVSVPVLEPLKI
jgi:hypothetical protein